MIENYDYIDQEYEQYYQEKYYEYIIQLIYDTH